jgi:hypothetical protein
MQTMSHEEHFMHCLQVALQASEAGYMGDLMAFMEQRS